MRGGSRLLSKLEPRSEPKIWDRQHSSYNIQHTTYIETVLDVELHPQLKITNKSYFQTFNHCKCGLTLLCCYVTPYIEVNVMLYS